jgi:hypothetical protein
MTDRNQYPVTAALEDAVYEARAFRSQHECPEPVVIILEQVGELEHQGMEPGAYSEGLTLEQYAEVALDIILGLLDREL